MDTKVAQTPEDKHHPAERQRRGEVLNYILRTFVIYHFVKVEGEVGMERTRWGGNQRGNIGSAVLRRVGLQGVNWSEYLVPYASSSLIFRFHCEGRILCTIFGLLFWHILFADVPGAFETPYQCAPLDIAEDCFYHAREGLIKDRLNEIEQGNARRILEKIDDKYRPKGTWCVGVRWDLFEKQDLLEIIDVSNFQFASCEC